MFVSVVRSSRSRALPAPNRDEADTGIPKPGFTGPTKKAPNENQDWRFRNFHPGDTAALLVLDLVASLMAYGRAPPGLIMAVIGEAAPVRAQLLIDANERGEPRPPLNVAKLTALAPNVCRLH
jgi:hypothetical protein